MITTVAPGGGILSLCLETLRIPYDRFEGYLFFLQKLSTVQFIIMKHRLRGKAYLGIVPPYPQKQTFAGMNREVMKSHWRNNRGSLLRPA